MEDNNIGFESIKAIRQRKEELLKSIRKDSKEIEQDWKSLFKADGSKSKNSKWVNLINTGSNVIDGLFLGWKLYRKFRKPFRW